MKKARTKQQVLTISPKAQKVSLWVALIFAATSAALPILFSFGQFFNSPVNSSIAMYILQPLVLFLVLFLTPFLLVGTKDVTLKRLFRAGFIAVIGGMVLAAIQQFPLFYLTSLFSSGDEQLAAASNEYLYGLILPVILLFIYVLVVAANKAKLAQAIK